MQPVNTLNERATFDASQLGRAEHLGGGCVSSDTNMNDQRNVQDRAGSKVEDTVRC